MVLYSAVTGVLFANLTISQVIFPFKTLKDIAKGKTLSLCMRDETFVYNDFIVSIFIFCHFKINGFVVDKIFHKLGNGKQVLGIN